MKIREVDFEGKRIPVSVHMTEGRAVPPYQPKPAKPASAPTGGETTTVPLIALAHGRSGDKGNLSNIAVMARKPEFLALLTDQLTPEAVKNYMAHVVEERGRTVRLASASTASTSS